VNFSPLLVTGYDLPNQLQSNPVEAFAIDGLANLGDFLWCNNLDQFLTYTINGVSKTLVTNLDVVFAGLDNGYVGAGLDTSLYISISFENLAMQQATIQSVKGTMYESGILHYYGCDYCFICNCSSIDPGILQFTEFPTAPGEYAAGTISSTIRPQGGGLPVPYSVNFRIKLE
jgi:hypothetical protein